MRSEAGDEALINDRAPSAGSFRAYEHAGSQNSSPREVLIRYRVLIAATKCPSSLHGYCVIERA
eukprot:scaffold31868_cov114-Isochrysis_galbana.AAC.3